MPHRLRYDFGGVGDVFEKCKSNAIARDLNTGHVFLLFFGVLSGLPSLRSARAGAVESHCPFSSVSPMIWISRDLFGTALEQFGGYFLDRLASGVVFYGGSSRGDRKMDGALSTWEGGGTKRHLRIPTRRKKEGGSNTHPTRLVSPPGSADILNPNERVNLGGGH